jgi:hypothetical protein
MSEKSCYDCRFFKEKTDPETGAVDDIGWCRRYAPISAMRGSLRKIDDMDGHADAVWPIVFNWEWCGEFATD